MAYLGRNLLGHILPLSVLTVDENGTPTVPLRPPRVKVWNSAGTKIVNEDMPVHDRYGTATQKTRFMLPVFLSGEFSVGFYTVTYYYQTEAGINYIEEDSFEIVAGGHGAGPVISVAPFHMPDAEWLLYETRVGAISRGRRPRV
jgi:hypothetical protein